MDFGLCGFMLLILMYRMYGYDDHTTPLQSDPNQLLIMPLPSSTNQ